MFWGVQKSERAGKKGKKEEGQPGSIVFFGIIRHCEHNFHVFSVKKALIRITGSVTHDWRQLAGC